jgi:YVTN family beta-propeller protein
MNTLLPALAFALWTLPLQDPPAEAAPPQEPPVRAATYADDPLDLLTGSELIVVNQGDDRLERVDARTGEILARIETGFMPHEAAISGDGRWAVTANYGNSERAGNSLTVLDLDGESEPRQITTKGHGYPHGIEFIDLDSEVLVTAEMSDSVVRVNILNGEIEAVIKVSGRRPHVIELNDERTRAYVCNVTTRNISVIDLETNEEIKVIDVGDQPEGLAMRPGGKELWVCNRAEHTISIIDTETLEVTETIETGKYPIRIGFNPDGQWAIVSCVRSSLVAMIDANIHKQVYEIPMKMIDYDPEIEKTHFGTEEWEESSVPYAIAIDPLGQYAFIGEVRSNTIAVLDIKEHKIVRRFKTGFLPDGLTLVQRSSVVEEAGQGD